MRDLQRPALAVAGRMAWSQCRSAVSSTCLRRPLLFLLLLPPPLRQDRILLPGNCGRRLCHRLLPLPHWQKALIVGFHQVKPLRV